MSRAYALLISFFRILHAMAVSRYKLSALAGRIEPQLKHKTRRPKSKHQSITLHWVWYREVHSMLIPHIGITEYCIII